MEEIKQFIVQNWQFISFALVVFFEFVLMFIKRRSKFVVQDTSIYQFLIDIINEAEGLFASGNGIAKKEFVIARFKERYQKTVEDWISYYKKTHPFDRGNDEKILDDTLSYFIEKILSTPQKKGGFGRESK